MRASSKLPEKNMVLLAKSDILAAVLVMSRRRGAHLAAAAAVAAQAVIELARMLPLTAQAANDLRVEIYWSLLLSV